MRRRTLSKLTATLIALFLVIQIPMGSVSAGISDTEGVGGFVARVYRTVMEREYDQEGFDFWTKGLINRELDAAKLMDCFVFSPEFQGYNISDEDYVRILYNSMMDREPDESGKEYWLDSLNRGMTRRRALSCFIDSQEFSDICAGYGVTRGTLPLTENVDIHTDKVMFVTGIYRNILGRDPDSEGLKNWTDYIVGGNNASDLILGFINSTEFKNRGLSDSEYVACLYKACLGREGGESEINSWVDYMDTHLVSRKYVFAQILGSQECSNLCRNYGIVAGSVALTESRDKCVPVNDFVINAFESILQRGPSVDDINYYSGQLTSSMTANQFLSSVLGSAECKAFNYSNEDFVKIVYKAALGREASDSEVSSYVSKIQSKGKNDFLSDIYGSQEYNDYCNRSKVSPNFISGWNTTAAGKVYIRDGAFLTGWQNIDGDRYYFDPSNNVAATGWKYVDGLKYYFYADGSLCQDVTGIIGDQDSYYLTVNCTTNTIMVYAKDSNGEYNIPVKAMICSSSAGGVTPSGTFTIQRLQAWRELMGPVWGQYCSRITGNYLFHSVWYYENGNANTQSVTQYNNLGKSVSHGCIRLTVADAKWIFDNCNGSQVKVFYSSESAPFDRPVPPPITALYGDYGHDPTDIWH